MPNCPFAVAVTVVTPAMLALSNPLVLIDATEVFEEDQVTVEVMFKVVAG
jgi:hypothetical protein